MTCNVQRLNTYRYIATYKLLQYIHFYPTEAAAAEEEKEEVAV